MTLLLLTCRLRSSCQEQQTVDIMNLRDAEILTNLYLDQFGLSSKGWTFAWNRRKRAFGTCFYSKKQIQLSRILTFAETEEGVKQTILHEIAHAFTPGAKHGPEWKRVAEQIGVRDTSGYGEFTCAPEARPKYTWGIFFEDRLVQGYFKKPAEKTFRKLPRMYLQSVGKDESMGKLYIKKIEG